MACRKWQAMRKVVTPQGIKNATPALTNELIINIRDSSCLVIGVSDLMYATTTVAGCTTARWRFTAWRRGLPRS